MVACDTVETPDKAIDWAELRALHVKGMSLADLAKRFNISYSAIRNKSSRERWRDTVAKAGGMVAQDATNQLSAVATKHLLKMSGIADLAIDQVATELAANPNRKALAELASIADTFDRIQRRTCRLDEDKANNKPASLTVNVAVQAGSSSVRQLGKVIDVDTIPAKQLDIGSDAGDASS